MRSPGSSITDLAFIGRYLGANLSLWRFLDDFFDNLLDALGNVSAALPQVPEHIPDKRLDLLDIRRNTRLGLA